MLVFIPEQAFMAMTGDLSINTSLNRKSFRKLGLFPLPDKAQDCPSFRIKVLISVQPKLVGVIPCVFLRT